MRKGYFGPFGGQFVPEFLYSAITELESTFQAAKKDKTFLSEFNRLLREELISKTNVVPLAVESVFQSSFPFVEVVAEK